MTSVLASSSGLHSHLRGMDQHQLDLSASDLGHAFSLPTPPASSAGAGAGPASVQSRIADDTVGHSLSSLPFSGPAPHHLAAQSAPVPGPSYDVDLEFELAQSALRAGTEAPGANGIDLLDLGPDGELKFPELPVDLLDAVPEYEYSAHTQANVFNPNHDLGDSLADLPHDVAVGPVGFHVSDASLSTPADVWIDTTAAGLSSADVDSRNALRVVDYPTPDTLNIASNGTDLPVLSAPGSMAFFDHSVGDPSSSSSDPFPLKPGQPSRLSFLHARTPGSPATQEVVVRSSTSSAPASAPPVPAHRRTGSQSQSMSGASPNGSTSSQPNYDFPINPLAGFNPGMSRPTTSPSLPPSAAAPAASFTQSPQPIVRSQMPLSEQQATLSAGASVSSGLSPSLYAPQGIGISRLSAPGHTSMSPAPHPFVGPNGPMQMRSSSLGLVGQPTRNKLTGGWAGGVGDLEDDMGNLTSGVWLSSRNGHHHVRTNSLGPLSQHGSPAGLQHLTPRLTSSPSALSPASLAGGGQTPFTLRPPSLPQAAPMHVISGNGPSTTTFPSVLATQPPSAPGATVVDVNGVPIANAQVLGHDHLGISMLGPSATMSGIAGFDAAMDADGIARCPFPNCPKTFAKNRSYNLKAHLRSHSQLKPFACSSCPRAFSRKHDLERHARVHSGDKPYICDACGKGFPRSDALRRHWRVEKECGEKAAAIEAAGGTTTLPAPQMPAPSSSPSGSASSSAPAPVVAVSAPSGVPVVPTLPQAPSINWQQQPVQEQCEDGSEAGSRKRRRKDDEDE